MALFEFRLPDVGEGTTEAEITAWHISVGDPIEEDKPLIDVSTDKAIVEITSPVTGRVVARRGEVGERMSVGTVLVAIELGASSPALVAPGKQTVTPPSDTTLAKSQPGVTRLGSVAPRASPATRRKAHELGVALESVVGTGPGGHITDADLVQHATSGAGAAPQPAAAATDNDAVQEFKIIGLRRTIAEKMVLSKRSIPHFTYVEELDVTELEALRGDLNRRRTSDQPKLTLLPFLMRAVVKLVAEFPRVNARYDEDARTLRCYRAIHMAIATQTDAGLMVPVIRHAETLDLWGSAREILRLSAAAREGRATRDELVGSTITLTSLGALGGISATPIINHPEVAIIGPNKMIDRPVVRAGQVVIRTMMNLSVSFDHRIIDGHEGARFVQELKRLVQQPALLFLDG